MGISPNEPLPDEFKRNIPRAKAAIEKKRLDEVDATSGWDDNELMKPSSEWEKSDREGTCGNGRRLFMGVPSKQYKKNYDLIDWSA